MIYKKKNGNNKGTIFELTYLCKTTIDVDANILLIVYTYNKLRFSIV